MKIEGLREKYPEFVYKGYSYKTEAGDLHISISRLILQSAK